MQTKQTLKPGDRGTRKLTEHFGDRLVCVRYRQDPETGRRFKTAEIIVEDALPVPTVADQDPHELLSLDIAYHEVDLRERVKAAGGRWDRENMVWKLPRYRVNKLQLESRIVSL
jgi:hypothetical protein